jgi:folate-dependent phosphoribosylglycinamide formyltransferase PurN
MKLFLARLEAHPEIELTACFCESIGQSFGAKLEDLWKRRRFLGLPVLVIQTWRAMSRFLSEPGFEIELNRILTRIAHKVYFVQDIHASSVIEQVCSIAPDLGLVYGSPILRPSLFQIPRFGTLGIHHGKLPEYRGKKTTFWALFNGAETAGVTVQRINEGVDTGDVVKQAEIPIEGRSFQEVWNDIELSGLDLYIQAILEVKQGIATYQRPTGTKGRLYGDPKLSDLLKFWWRRHIV